MNQPLFTRVSTALVTPFLGGKVNYPMLERLLARQMEAGITSVVLCGTTGEAPTLTDTEKLEMVCRAKRYVGNQCQIIAGTGSNCTEHTVALSRAAEGAGADALLVVSPYYNKATKAGLLAHYGAVCSAVHIPVICYNVPSRTGLDMTPAVYRGLSAMPNMVGVKEASTDAGKVTEIRAACPEQFTVWSGNDTLAAAAMALGAKGVISVASNVLPSEMLALASAALDGDFDTAADLQVRLLPLLDVLFSEVNPIPVKEAMKCLGFDCGVCRLPLTPLSQRNAERLKKVLSEV